MKILHVSQSNVYSGVEIVAINIIKSMPDTIESVYLTKAGPIETKLLEHEIEFIAVENVDEKAIEKAIDEVKPDIIHAYEYDASMLCAKCTNSLPIISHLYSSPHWIRKIGPKSVSYGGACKNFTKIITVSSSVEKEAWFKDKIAGKSRVLGNPFSPARVFEKGYLAATEMSKEKLDAYKSDILYVAHLTQDKNPFEFIYIINEIKKTHPDIKAIMVGSGDLGAKCIKLISKLSLEDNIKMVGFQYNPFIYMNQTRMLIITSSFEGFGLATLEAMTFAKPVLTSCVEGPTYVVNDACGYICGNAKKPIDRNLFVENALELLDDESIYQAKSAAARKRAKDFDNFDDYMKEIKLIYEDICSN